MPSHWELRFYIFQKFKCGFVYHKLATSYCVNFNVIHYNVEDHDDRSKPPLIRGRFKVIPGHVDFDKVLAKINSHCTNIRLIKQ